MGAAATRPELRLAFLAAAVAACVSTVRAPVDPVRPVAVYLRSEARHQALLLPRPDGFVEYGYGDYDWYALGKDRWYHVFDTLLWPTQGTLGRRFLPARDVHELLATHPWFVLTPVEVEGERAERLARRLAEEFEASGESELNNPDYDLSFVPHPDRFCLLHNCHDAAADWLRELGCTVSSACVRLGLSVERPAPPEP
jgi:hypothetical protein